MKAALALLLNIVCFFAFSQKVETAFILPEKDLIPEGIAYDQLSKSFFISSIFKKKIVRVDSKGKTSDFISSGQDGIEQVLGLKVADGRLWACSNISSEGGGSSMIHLYDLASAKLIRKWTFPFTTEKHLFNDLAIINEEAFISDSDDGSVFRASEQHDQPELFVKDNRLRDINGIALLKDDELVVNASTGFFEIGLKTKEIKRLPFEGYFPLGIDGLCKHKRSLIGIQNVVFPVSINQYFLNAGENKIERADVLVSNHPLFEIPTTGTMVGEWFYFIANSQMLNMDQDKIKDPAKLKEVVIMKVKVN